MPPHQPWTDDEPMPRGGWFAPDNTVMRRRIVHWATIAGVLAGCAVGIAGAALTYAWAKQEPGLAILFGAGMLPVGGLAFIVVQSIGLVLTGVNWSDLFHDLRIRSVWAILLEMTLFLLTAAMMAYSALDAVKHHSAYSACVFALLVGLTWWPFIRQCIRHRRWPS